MSGCHIVGLQLTFELPNINADEIVQFDLLFLRKDKDENKIRRDKHDLFQGMVQLQIVMNRQNIFLTKSQHFESLKWPDEEEERGKRSSVGQKQHLGF